ncbi:MAG TPA: VOC family protein [Candidatus Limnocylindria bacterium]|jgi:catechol 2,3-dioxygenase-like lactoylglutathione lyase family enzyme|nr:VOC family protein [Candidatus Limnocylindria bacterium]
MKVLFVAGFGPIVRDMGTSLRLYRETLGLPIVEGEDVSTEKVDGVKHFGLWPLDDAAESCFGKREWPAHIAAPQAWIEFDVDDVAASAEELRAKGYRLLVGPKTEPWGQTVARLQSPEGLLVGVTMTPWMREGGGH